MWPVAAYGFVRSTLIRQAIYLVQVELVLVLLLQVKQAAGSGLEYGRGSWARRVRSLLAHRPAACCFLPTLLLVL
jgi:hypothetical protein